MMLLALIGAALAGVVATATAGALLLRTQVAHMARSRADLSQQWRQLAQIWDALDLTTRTRVRLTSRQRVALFVALLKSDWGTV